MKNLENLPIKVSGFNFDRPGYSGRHITLEQTAQMVIPSFDMVHSLHSLYAKQGRVTHDWGELSEEGWQ